jgi:hypothetical protein
MALPPLLTHLPIALHELASEDVVEFRAASAV